MCDWIRLRSTWSPFNESSEQKRTASTLQKGPVADDTVNANGAKPSRRARTWNESAISLPARRAEATIAISYLQRRGEHVGV
jgi:hypothetical protein